MKSALGVFFVCLAAALSATPALSQQTQAEPVRLSFEQPVGAKRHTAVATINPFAVILGGFNGDVEMNMAPGMTGALSVSWFPDELDYTSVDFTFRYYPGELNPEGFSVGASLGYVSIDDEDVGERSKGAAVGFIGGYTWLLGKSDRLAIATGIGLKRLLSDTGPEVMPSGRMGIGLAF